MKLFKDYHSQRREQLLNHLVAFLDEQNNKTTDELSEKALHRIKDFATSGKMLRGIFVLLAYEMFGGKINKNILNVATVMELSQASLLIHDDIMDNDTLRRGKKTIYAQYMEDGESQSIDNPDEYGKSMAIIVGDASIFLTYELIGELDVPSAVRSQVMKTYSHEMLKVALGQFMDYHFGKTETDRSYDEIEKMYSLKTGAYTFTLPFAIGAYMAHASEDDCEILEEITQHLGIIFQIKDDELGLFGKTEVTGKRTGADLEENKKTLLLALLHEKLHDDEKEKLGKLLGNPVGEDDINYVHQLMESYGILKQMNSKVSELSSKAEALIGMLNIEPDHQELFRELVQYNAIRGK